MTAHETTAKLLEAMMVDLRIPKMKRQPDLHQHCIEMNITRDSIENELIPLATHKFADFLKSLQPQGLVVEGYTPHIESRTVDAGPLGKIDILATANVYLLLADDPRINATKVRLQQTDANLLN